MPDKVAATSASKHASKHDSKRPLLCSAIAAVTLLLTSCATQMPPSSSPPASSPPGGTVIAAPDSPDQAALRALVAQQDRLYQVAAPLLVNNADLCKGNARNLLGFTAKNKYSYSTELTDTARTLLGLGENLQVMGVLAGSGASRAGVRRGDTLVSVEGALMPPGPQAERQAAAILVPMLNARTNVQLTVLRNGTDVALNVPLTRACAFSIELGNADHINAYADGRRVMITRGMLSFTRTDEELAYVLAKEMAHNSLAHAGKQRQAGTIGEIIDNLARPHPDLSIMVGTAGVKATPSELDAEADRLAVYMLARAGYNVDQVAGFWDRLARQYPPSVLNGYTAIHPSTSHRLMAIDKTTAEVKAKQAAKQALIP